MRIFSLIFVGKKCVFLFRPMKIVTFLRKNRETAKRVVDFLRERDTFRNKIMEIVEDFDGKKVRTTVNLEIVEDFACESIFHFSFFFHHFFSIFRFFFIFHFSCSFIVFTFRSFSFIFFHFLCLCWVLKI